MLDPVPASTTLLWTSVLTISVVLLWYRRHQGRTLPLPPGPTPIPIIGNALSIPTRTPWMTYARWSDEYNSDLVSFTAFGQLYIVVNSLKAAKELFERRSAIYSSRPHLEMLHLTGWGFNVGLMPYGDEWRARRRLLRPRFGTGRASVYHPLQIAKTREMLRQVYEDPKAFRDHLRVLSASLAMKIAYGHDIAPKDDRFVELVEKSVDMLSEATAAAGVLNVLPLLLRLPSWVPGMGVKALAQKCSVLTSEMLEVPWNTVKHQMAEGTAHPSLASTWIAENKACGAGEEADHTARDAASVLYAAGADTSTAATTIALLALLLNPDTQRRAQDEIDSVLPRTSLPTFENRCQLPYVGAVVREVFRWHQVAPLAVMREAGMDDIYDGMFIPKGAQIVPNLWAMTHDQRIYTEPHKFKPERFLTKDGTLNSDESKTTFGFGRRTCAGQNYAEMTVWITVASFLAVYRISKARDTEGNEIPVDVAFSEGIVSYPHPFECSIEPRDAQAEALLKSLQRRSD